MSLNCKVNGCGFKTEKLSTLKRHTQSEHSGDIETPEEHLGGVESEQLDFDGDEPDTSDYNPEYETEIGTPETEPKTLSDYE